MAVYYGDFKDYDHMLSRVDSVIREALPAKHAIVYAGYDVDGYDGEAIIVFKRGGRLFENHDSHCSCMGLESWKPEETTKAAILMRPEDHWPGLHTAVRKVRLRKT